MGCNIGHVTYFHNFGTLNIAGTANATNQKFVVQFAFIRLKLTKEFHYLYATFIRD